MTDRIIIWVPRDAAARSVGADAVAEAFAREAEARGLEVTIRRNGSRGLFWLEPLVEIATGGQRIGYGPVSPEDAAGILDEGGGHALCLGPVGEIGFLKRQQRVTFRRCGVIDPLDPEDYAAHGGWAGLERAAKMTPEAICEEVTRSGLRGRGGAGFPAGIKWTTVLEADGAQKYVCCNADEGDSGAFADRMIMEGDPFTVIEGMILAGFATGSTQGFIYIRSEYPDAISVMREAIAIARAGGFLGTDILGSGRDFDIILRRGAGAYICGEESSMLNSLEGKRGEVRAKPPIPALSGLFGEPTVVNNVLTLASVPMILSGEPGADGYKAIGLGRSAGTQPFQLAGNIRQGGLVELAFGVTLRELIEDFGGGTLSGRPVRAVQAGGPLGAYIPAHQFDTPMSYEALADIGAMLGHGGLTVFDDQVDMAKMAEFAFEFCAEESCGKCTPCRIGAVRGAETMAKIRRGENVEANLEIIGDLAELMRDGSLCAMGGLTPMPVMSAIEHFPEDFPGQASKEAAE
ncbi:NADH-ubiquinone oxidoreductase-F iron-sulfur binding region domain-containing protein [Hyphobacterium sp. HN65]|uniref:NADH-ubiquinone oxidoreductase-F iron-sulfur binding region domain-containing protein n=1 Tax=Hyphobacterium lacteum TaxID=3116575 RepID=A0ABU7LSA6_9PROT|nr:NADH-ubiquinone oxidoreductase-F iron-sulfur binding region domain-containing protein [Hyphobacterium sp. HN65]MEE2526803.1 NADH-ubiquinone oxidoreductase-F iron-sulfur binding region domain-containing protein [Hyphobacterium sp. HN65]